MSNELTYRLTANWESGRKGVVAMQGVEPKIHFSSPPEFKGDPGYWTPEHLLLAAVASCFVVTFYSLAERSRVDFGKLDLSVEGVLGTLEGRLSVQQIILQPTVTILQSQYRDRAYRLLAQTEHGCLIARALNCLILMEPLVQTAEKVLAQ